MNNSSGSQLSKSHLSKSQKDVYGFIQRFINERGMSPTIQEIQSNCSLRSPATVHYHLGRFEEMGLIKRRANVSRGITLTRSAGINDSADSVEIPLLGYVAAGEPIEAILQGNWLTIPQYLLGRTRTYGLIARGDSMINEGILDGDHLVIESRETAENGETVVALLNKGATIKKFRRDERGIQLIPANEKYKPIEIQEGDDLRIQGRLIGVIRMVR